MYTVVSQDTDTALIQMPVRYLWYMKVLMEKASAYDYMIQKKEEREEGESQHIGNIDDLLTYMHDGI